MTTTPCDDPTCILGYRYQPDQPKGERNTPCPICRPPYEIPVPPPEPRDKPRKPLWTVNPD